MADTSDAIIYLAATGKDVDIYLCDELLNDFVIRIAVSEGSVPEKFSSFGSAVIQQFGLPPSSAEIQLTYYHTEKNTDKLHRILIKRYIDIIKWFHGYRANNVVSKEYINYTNMLQPLFSHLQEQFGKKTQVPVDDAMRYFSALIHDNYPRDVEDMQKILNRSYISDKNYGFDQVPNFYTNIALSNVASEFFGLITKYFNTFISNMNRWYTDDIVIDKDTKFWYYMSIYGYISLIVTTNRSRLIEQSTAEDYMESIRIADFKKYFAINPFGFSQYETRNNSDPLYTTKVLYSMGQFDSDFAPRNDRVPQNIDQLKDLVNYQPLMFADFITSHESAETGTQEKRIFQNFSELLNFPDYLNNKNLTTPYSYVSYANELRFSQTSLTRTNTGDTMLSYTRVANGGSLGLIYRDYTLENNIVGHNLVNVCFGSDSTKKLFALMVNNDKMLSYLKPAANTSLSLKCSKYYDAWVIYYEHKDSFAITEPKISVSYDDGTTAEYVDDTSFDIPMDLNNPNGFKITYSFGDGTNSLSIVATAALTLNDAKDNIDLGIDFEQNIEGVEEANKKEILTIINNTFSMKLAGKSIPFSATFSSESVNSKLLTCTFKKQKATANGSSATTDPGLEAFMSALGFSTPISATASDIAAVKNTLRTIDIGSYLYAVEFNSEEYQVKSISKRIESKQ